MAAIEERGKSHAINNAAQRFIHRLFPPHPLPERRHTAKSFWEAPFGTIFFSDSFNVIKTTISRQLEIEDISQTPTSQRVLHRSTRLKYYIDHYRSRNSKQPLLRALAKCYRREIIVTGLCRAYRDLAELSHSLMYFVFITYLTHRRDHSEGWRYTYGAGVGLMAASATILLSFIIADAHSTSGITLVGSNIKTSLDSLILQKSFVISPFARRKNVKDGEFTEWSEGALVSLMNTDSERIFNAANFFHFLWMPILLIPLGMGLSYFLMGWSGLAGLVTMFAFYPFMWVGSKVLSNQRRKLNVYMDKRNEYITDSIKSIRFLKFFVLEDYFFGKIEKARMAECYQNYRVVTYQNLLVLVAIASSRCPSIVGTFLFSVYGNMSGSRVISFYALTRMLSEFSFNFSPALNEAINAYLSIKRIEEYFLAEEYVDNRVEDIGLKSAIRLIDAKCKWKEDDEDEKGTKDEKENKIVFSLKPVNLEIQNQELIAIVGPSGCGKSSLLSAIIGGMHHQSGSILLKSSIAYCPQRPWIQNATIRDNVLFGLPLDQDKYDRVLYDCALTPDISKLPHGDLSELGERGINLSGGQKQRLQLARALYMDRNIILMDDPLSAVDAHVSRHLFENVICGEKLSAKTRVLVTHQLQVLSRCDRIIFMEDGEITACDTYNNLLQNDMFVKFLQDCKQSEDVTKRDQQLQLRKDEEENGFPEKNENDDLFLVHDKEERSVSSVSWRTYHNFIRIAGSYFFLLLLLIACAFSHAFNVAIGLAFAWWSNNTWQISNLANLGITVGFVVGQLLTYLIFMIFVMVFSLRGSRRLSLSGLSRVLNAPVSFFDRNPIGRIINRFTVDVNQLDTELPLILWHMLFLALALISIVVLLMVYVYITAALLVPWIMFALCLVYIYKSSPREIKRLEALANSKVSAQLFEGYSGKDSIKNSDQMKKFLGRLHQSMDDLNSIRREFYYTLQWSTITQCVLGCIFYFGVGLLMIWLRDKIDPSIGGFVLFNTALLSVGIRFILNDISKLQKTMVSVERLQYYGREIRAEGDRRVEGFNANKQWPQTGAISLQNVDMRYHERLKLTLQNVNLEIPGNSKVGIVGRTGAGKSSLIQVLMRLVDISNGRVLIDGVDIKTQAGLHDLREHIAVIPQDPTLFEGTVRSNLDPLGEKDDFILNAALKNASLINESSDNGFNLDRKIESGGENLSNGQRQLMALARALVKDSKIMISDEATSSIDYETDSKIQQVMMNLVGKTVISIAHRIRTILHYDYICVMDNGHVVDFDTPLNLFDKEDSLFRSMCEESKLTRDDILGNIQ